MSTQDTTAVLNESLSDAHLTIRILAALGFILALSVMISALFVLSTSTSTYQSLMDNHRNIRPFAFVSLLTSFRIHHHRIYNA